MDIRSVLGCATLDLERQGFSTPKLDAEVLLSHCLRKDRSFFYAHPETQLTEEEIQRFQESISRRLGGEPIAYIVGQKEFWSLPFEVNNHVLIPRPETELLIETILRIYAAKDSGNLMILEIGTGSGVISVALASELKNAHIVATDISFEALSVAARNARKNGVEHRISFLRGSLFETVSEKFDIIVTNPPYVPEGEFNLLPWGIRGFEPKLALIAGMEGIAFHKDIIRQGAYYLRERGRLFVEMGADQKERIIELFKESFLYEDVAFIRDYVGLDRVFTAKRRKEIING